MAERTGLTAYGLVALFVGVVIYPLIGHWAWGTDFSVNHQDGEAAGWLKKFGFLDFAGSTVVHSVGAWVALVGIYVEGPRRRRFNSDGSVNHDSFPPYNLAYSALGVFILWLGWWGFNGGSQLRYDLNVSAIVLNTNIAAAFGGLTALAFAMWTDRARAYEKLIGGILGGLVAITAPCNVVNTLDAVLIGMTAGVLHNLAYDAMFRLKLDDPVGAIPVHGACGIWGTLCVALFGNLEKIAHIRGVDVAALDRMAQLGIQALGVGVVLVVVVGLTAPFMLLLDRFVGIRVSAIEEDHGFVIGTTHHEPRVEQ